MAVHLRNASAGKPHRDWSAPAQRVFGSAAALVRCRWRLTLPGAWVALLFACVSLTPSLLPRSAPFQGFVTGVSAAIGYGLGVLGAWLWREFADRDPRTPSQRAWRVFLVVTAAALTAFFVVGQVWQRQIRDLMGMPPQGLARQLLFPVVAVLLFTLILAVSRGLRWVYRRLAARLERRIGARAARGTGLVVVVVATALLVSGVVLDGLIAAADRTFAVRDLTTPGDVTQPTTGLRSGGPGSVVAWDSLGREGRKFTGRGPTAQDISAFTGQPAQEPIRAFAGYASADETEDRAELAVRDLARAGGFERTNLLVFTTTGSGWVEPSSATAFEYMTGGDSAIVAMQYSHLPSWISYLVDQERAREAGRELFDAVYARWTRLPAADRPNLYVFGESLGSFGAETAFSGEYDMANRTHGALLVGPPSFNTLYREFTDERDPTSREVEPVYRNGRTVRFSTSVRQGIPPETRPWPGPRVLYLQHPSDPIVWWSPKLLWDEPDWLDERPGRDVLPEMAWFPFVTFWQVTADLPLAIEVPAGHGHVYTGEHVDGWAAVLRPDGWTAEEAGRLRDLILDEH